VRSIDEALGLKVMAPLLDHVRRLLEPELVRGLADPERFDRASQELRLNAVETVPAAVAAAAERAGFAGSTSSLQSSMLLDLEALLALRDVVGDEMGEDGGASTDRAAPLREALADPAQWASSLVRLVARRLGDLEGPGRGRERASARYLNWYLGSLLVEALQSLGVDWVTARRTMDAVEVVITNDGELPDPESNPGALSSLFEDSAGARAAGINTYEAVRWLHRESFERLVRQFVVASSVNAVVAQAGSATERVVRICTASRKLVEAAQECGYRVDDLVGRVDDGHRSGVPESCG
jgi:hypothetical protein